MTLEEQGNRLREELARLGSLQARRYTPGVRALILGWVERAKHEGMSEAECGRRLAIPTRRFAEWRALDKAPPAKQFVPVEVREEAEPTLGLVFVAPTGFRVDGLTLEQAISMMRAFV